jgi:hypothetical protein
MSIAFKTENNMMSTLKKYHITEIPNYEKSLKSCPEIVLDLEEQEKNNWKSAISFHE